MSREHGTTKRLELETLLGSATSSVRGSYQIAWLDSPVVSQRVCTLASCPESQFVVRALQPAGKKPLHESEPMSATGKWMGVDLPIQVRGQKLSAARWSDVGSRLKSAGLTKLSDLVKQLAFASSTQSLFADWSSELRQTAVAALETAFLDPKGRLGKIAPVPSWHALSAPGGLDAYKAALGEKANQRAAAQAFTELSQKLTSFDGISSIDWVIDPSQFRKSPAAAITANQGNYFGPNPSHGPIPIRFSPEIGYRDYLRTQWTSTVTLVEYIQPHNATVADAEQQLRNRFHQDFRTQDTTSRAANEILIPILTEILTATGADFGFGIPPASIPRAARRRRVSTSTLSSA